MAPAVPPRIIQSGGHPPPLVPGCSIPGGRSSFERQFMGWLQTEKLDKELWILGLMD